MDADKKNGGIFRMIARGYADLLKAIGEWAAVGAGLLALSALVVYPLWFFARSKPALYALCLGLIALGGLAVAAVFYARRSRALGKGRAEIVRSIVRVPLLIVAWAALLLSAYLTFAFAACLKILPALVTGLVCLALAGYLFFGRKLKRS
jgi:hypothetical protein